MNQTPAENPLVSIIVRTKDRPKLLNRALKSIFEQTYRPIEVVLVNDGGCDLDIEEIRGILRDVSLNYLPLEKNMGRAHAGNVGIANAKGEYIGFLDDDDEFYPEHIETILPFLINNKNIYSGAYSDAEIVERQYDEDGNIQYEINKGVFKSLDFSREIMLFENYIPFMTCIFHRYSIINVGGIDEFFEIFEDWDLLLRITKKEPLYHIQKLTAKYIHWSKTHQIAFTDCPKAKEFYLIVLEKNLDLLTPEIIYKFIAHKQRELLNLKVDLEASDAFEKTFQEIKMKVSELERVNISYLEKIKETSIQLEGLKSELISLQKTKEDLHLKLMQNMHYIEEIHNSLGWKLLMYFRNKIKPKLIGSQTKREAMYKLMIKVILSLQNRGLKGTFRRIREKINQKRVFSKISKENFTVPILPHEDIIKIDKKVSVIIPTKNAGDEFNLTLSKIRSQQGIRELEIIVVDSGSTDNTLDIAQIYGSKIFNIRAEDFNHGNVRNFGAKNSTGDYIVFMSQDVIPITDSCLNKIINTLERDNTIAGATVKQVPRSDADLFSCWQLWYYYNKLLFYRGDRVTSVNKEQFARLTPEEKRRLCPLDNVFCCYRKDVFDNFLFNPLPYAEDLDLGIRLINGGYKLFFFDSVGVIHSHNRPPSYYFKRSYIDVLFISRLLNINPIRWDEFNIKSTEDILSQIYALYLKTNHLARSLENNQFSGLIIELFDFVKSLISNNNISFIGEKSLDDLMFEINQKGSIFFNKNVRVSEIFLNLYLSLFESFCEFLSSTRTNVDNTKEIISAIHKLFAVIGGSCLGNYGIYLESNNITDYSYPKIVEFLKGGV